METFTQWEKLVQGGGLTIPGIVALEPERSDELARVGVYGDGVYGDGMYDMVYGEGVYGEGVYGERVYGEGVYGEGV